MADTTKINKLRSDIIKQRAEFLRSGQLMEARTLLHLLNRKRVCLGLSDESWNVETALEKINCPINYSRRGYTATAYIPN